MRSFTGMAAAFALAALVTGCASLDASQSHTSSVITDSIPKWAGGEPANTPPRPAQEAAYPYVNEQPPRRSEKPLTEEEQKKLVDDLTALRKRVNARAKADPEEDRRQVDALTRGKLAGEPKSSTSN